MNKTPSMCPWNRQKVAPLLYGQPHRTCVERRGVLFIVEAESSNPEQLRSEHVTRAVLKCFLDVGLIRLVVRWAEWVWYSGRRNSGVGEFFPTKLRFEHVTRAGLKSFLDVGLIRLVVRWAKAVWYSRRRNCGIGEIFPNAITIRTCHPSRVKMFPGRWADSVGCALGQVGWIQCAGEFR